MPEFSSNSPQTNLKRVDLVLHLKLMTDLEKLQAWDAGFKAYFEGVPQKDCPDYADEESRGEWNVGWLTALSADERGE